MKITKYYGTQESIERYHKLRFTLDHPVAVKKSEYKRTRLSKMPDMPDDLVVRLMDQVLASDPIWPKEYRKAITTYKFITVTDQGKYYFLIRDKRLFYMNELYVDPQNDNAIYELEALKASAK
jgi:hypothetical protein